MFTYVSSVGYNRAEPNLRTAMANEEHLKILRQGVDDWNSWRNEHPGLSRAYQGIAVEGNEFTKVDFTGADLTGIKLRGADLKYVDFAGANLTGAVLRHADLREAEFKGADLSGVDLMGVNLSGANLAGASLSEAKLHETIFANVNLTDTKDLESCIHFGPSIIDHRTLAWSKDVPINFWRGCGLPDQLIDYMPSLISDAIQFYSCFISYSHADKSFARRLYDQLQGQGIRCWLDEHQMLPGDDIFERVDEGIRLWDKILLCCSNDSLSSWWVENEINSAFVKEQKLQKERGQKALALIPLNLDDHLFVWQHGMANQVRKRLAADFTGWEHNNAKFESQFDLVVKALRSDEGAREKPPIQKL